MKKYFALNQYSMLCTLYPNKTQAKKIDDIIHAIHVYHNNIIYDMRINGLYLKESEDKLNPGEFVHWPDWKTCGGLFEKGMKDKNFYKSYIEKDERIGLIPASTLVNQTKSIIDDMKKAFEKTGCHPIERWDEKYKDEKGNEIEKGIKYYTKSHPRKSFSTQIQCSAIHPALDKDDETKQKNNVFFITVPKVGLVKVRGWNKDIRFDPNGEIDFLEFCKKNPKKQLSCTIKHDTDEKYYISISFSNMEGRGKFRVPCPVVWKSQNIPDIKKDFEGMDVGEINIAVLSDGTMYSNIFDKFPKLKKEKDTLIYYDEKLSKMWGYKNLVFRYALYNAHKRGYNLAPSNQYIKYTEKRKKLYQKIVRQRKDYYHKLSLMIATNTNVLAVETLKVSEMFDRKEEGKEAEKTNREMHCHNKNLADYAMSDFLSMIKYKCDWYETALVEVDQFFPSTKRCSNCGHVMDEMPTDIREWDCPICGKHHQRDVNSAQNLKEEGIRLYTIKIGNVA